MSSDHKVCLESKKGARRDDKPRRDVIIAKLQVDLFIREGCVEYADTGMPYDKVLEDFDVATMKLKDGYYVDIAQHSVETNSFILSVYKESGNDDPLPSGTKLAVLVAK